MKTIMAILVIVVWLGLGAVGCYTLGVQSAEDRMLGKCVVAGATTTFCAALVRP